VGKSIVGYGVNFNATFDTGKKGTADYYWSQALRVNNYYKEGNEVIENQWEKWSYDLQDNSQRGMPHRLPGDVQTGPYSLTDSPTQPFLFLEMAGPPKNEGDQTIFTFKLSPQAAIMRKQQSFNQDKVIQKYTWELRSYLVKTGGMPVGYISWGFVATFSGTTLEAIPSAVQWVPYNPGNDGVWGKIPN
jgi:hypothetical protein